MLFEKGLAERWHCETCFTRTEVRSLVLRTLIWGTRGVKGRAHCAIGVVPTLAQRTRKNGAPPHTAQSQNPLSSALKCPISTPK
jgi:hypothetical protein